MFFTDLRTEYLLQAMNYHTDQELTALKNRQMLKKGHRRSMFSLGLEVIMLLVPKLQHIQDQTIQISAVALFSLTVIN